MTNLKDFFLKQKEATHQGTLKVRANIPPHKLGWRPAEGMLILEEIVRHIWQSEEALRHAALEDNWDYFEERIPKGLQAVLGEIKSLADEVRQIERVHAETLRTVAAYAIERWEEERTHEKLKIRRRVSLFLFGISEHQIHHRAQVGAYLHILTGNRASPYAV